MDANILVLKAFKQLLIDCPKMFHQSDWAELEALITPLPDDAAQLANAITDWCTSHSKIYDQMMALIASMSSSYESSDEKWIGGINSTPAEISLEDLKNQKETLLNAIRNSSKAESSTSNTEPENAK
ncbi:MAG TPA: hypothetical protein DCY88_17545 [Cyanobacteria bacterium UBA11372]|nr:hypothetical protein [Cyanobacteria bacterium UBA11372]HBE48576.1 hypothetical protein [Cyanobacteria bacterium UBA11369]